MAYNLLARRIEGVLLHSDDTEHNVFEDSSENDEDTVTDESVGTATEILESYDGEDTETSMQKRRTLESRPRGRKSMTLRGKNGFQWSTRTPAGVSDSHSNETEQVPSPKNEPVNCNEIHEFWYLLFDEEMRKKIVESTNAQIEDVHAMMIANDQEMQTYQHDTDLQELHAYIGLLYYAGLWKTNCVDIEELWSKRNGISFYRCVMPKARFMFLSVCLRFEIRDNKQPDDRLSPIRELWDMFMKNCKQYYEPGNRCTVDEQLLGFRGRCEFRMFIKSKPNKYGLNIISLNDASTSYLIHGIPYLGNTAHPLTESISEYFFREVTASIHGTNRTVTCDNWFTSVRMIEKMLDEPYKMTITGKIRKGKPEIPAEMKVAAKSFPSSKFCHADKLSLVCFTPKKHKIILVTSSFIKTAGIGEKQKPEMILHYNKDKGGMDKFDQLCHMYTVSRQTRRWSMRFFYGMLDQAQVNSRILSVCKRLNVNANEAKIPAKHCLRSLVIYLTEPHLRARYKKRYLCTDIKKGIASILQHKQQPSPLDTRQPVEKRARCRLCDSKNDHKMYSLCSSCSRPMCDDHRVYLCYDCAGSD